ncbi:hypothetical protein EON65_44065 [archaeon]|nr:MAG: hypothetical protein EON65_44065 [archaeon]
MCPSHFFPASTSTRVHFATLYRSQASKLPAVFRVPEPSALVKASHQMTKQILVEEVPACPAHLKPSEDWEREVAHAFSELRLVLTRGCFCNVTCA